MAKAKKGKTGKKSKKQVKVVETKAKDKMHKKGKQEVVRKPKVVIKIEPDEFTFTYRDLDQVLEAEKDAVDCGMSLSEYVRQVRPEIPMDIIPKIEPVVKQEPDDSDSYPDPEINSSNLRDDTVVKDEILDDSTKILNKDSKECPICHKSFKFDSELKRHEAVHKEKTLKCDLCDRLFGLQIQLNRHKDTHMFNRKRYPCKVCQKEFSTEQNLKRHRNVHDLSRKLYECRFCQKELTSSSSLKNHIQRTHEGKEGQKCTFCDKKFAQNTNLITHMQFEHFTLLRQQDKGTGDLHPIFLGRRTYECYRCKLVGVRKVIEKHMSTCKGEKKFLPRAVQCELCSNRFETKNGFKRHMRLVHSIYLKKEVEIKIKGKPKKKPTECLICHKIFKHNSALKIHEVVHKEKSHKCDICDKLFGLKSNLDKHKNTIHSVTRKKYPCDICQMEIQSEEGLRRHRKTHDSSRKLHECRMCHKVFKYAHCLKEHTQRKHEGKTESKCAFCDRQFEADNSLLVHMRSKHFTLLRQQDKGTGDLHPVFQGRRTYECYRCKYSTATLPVVKQHMQICKGEKRVCIRTVKCELCTRRFTDKGSLKRHMRLIHSIHLTSEAVKNIQAGKPHKCTFCDKSFLQLYERIFHTRTEHFSLLRQQDKGTGDLHPIFRGNRSYECYRCKYSTKALTYVRQHIETCKGIRKQVIERPVECEFCDMRLLNHRCLGHHLLRIHSINEAQRKREQMLRNAEKIFECIDCKRCCITKDGLIKHIKVHCKKRAFE